MDDVIIMPSGLEGLINIKVWGVVPIASTEICSVTLFMSFGITAIELHVEEEIHGNELFY